MTGQVSLVNMRAIMRIWSRWSTFDYSNQGNNDVGIWVVLHGMQDTMVDLVGPLHLLQAVDEQLKRQELTQLVHHIERRVVDQVPVMCHAIFLFHYLT